MTIEAIVNYHLHLVAEQHRIRSQAIEEACEAALKAGVCGVLVYRDDAGVEHIGPHSDVPYGEMHFVIRRPIPNTGGWATSGQV